METFIKIHPLDNTAVALTSLSSGQEICGVILTEDIAQGHKFALCNIPAGTPIIKYGNSIGTAKTDIVAGSWVHTHNIRTSLGELLTYTYDKNVSALTTTKDVYFQGYRRANGDVGIRNEIWIIPTVGCVNSVATAVEKLAQKYKTENIDAIAAFTHPYGCSQMGDDQENTRQILADLVNHPNAAGVLVLGLGCENSNIAILKEYIGSYDQSRVKFLIAQECENEIENALSLIKELIRYADTFHREPISCSELIIGMKCGGSDGLSGITANPTVGRFSDMLISKGGTTILTEVPEMFGAETTLMNRCETEELFNKTVNLINDYKKYFQCHNQVIYENPSPGNKKGGISTLEDKSLGCTQKSGSAPVKGVLAYGEKVSTRGLNLLSAPGNDLVASTALAASGAHIILFTTGRGTPFASPVPTIKISSNSQLFERKKDWIDFDCGALVNYKTPPEIDEEFFSYIISVASGKKVKSEKAGFHDMAIFKQGVTL